MTTPPDYSSPTCGYHPESLALAACVRCGTFICETCRRISFEGRSFCSSCIAKELNPKSKDTVSTGILVLLFFGNLCVTPWLGVILYLVWRENKPQSAKKAIISSLIVFVLYIMFIVLLVLSSFLRI